MHVRAINDNQAQPYAPREKDIWEEGLDAKLVQKLGKLKALRTTLSDLDPATNGPPALEHKDTPAEQHNDYFPRGWIHELWVPNPKDHGAAMAWALSTLKQGGKPLLWVTSQTLMREQGMPYGPGLLHIGHPPEQFIIARTKTHEDGLWALEEAIKSGAFSAVIGELSDIDLTSSRRLSLAAQNHKAQCLLLMRSAKPPQTVAYSRWRVDAAASEPETEQTSWPGKARLTAHLHKHRGGELPRETLLEWHDAHHRFHMVSPLVREPLGPQPHAQRPEREKRAAG
ncbi:MAG: hypothetical protein JJ850_02380 [Kordiimonadaceae bacterium]|nr:hypothetical protein [Kordiimonadaceae bacterium]MBO6567348.1 hypothetical protein [Kordiimonadaceae bacterium]MBO6963438.1 hypothetical protein [Kordiimonadaceae bacterium]